MKKFKIDVMGDGLITFLDRVGRQKKGFKWIKGSFVVFVVNEEGYLVVDEDSFNSMVNSYQDSIIYVVNDYCHDEDYWLMVEASKEYSSYVDTLKSDCGGLEVLRFPMVEKTLPFAGQFPREKDTYNVQRIKCKFCGGIIDMDCKYVSVSCHKDLKDSIKHYHTFGSVQEDTRTWERVYEHKYLGTFIAIADGITKEQAKEACFPCRLKRCETCSIPKL